MKRSSRTLKFTSIALIVLSLLGWAVIYRSASAQSQTYDAVADFNDTTNTAGQVWQYGYTGTDGSGFTRYATPSNAFNGQRRGWAEPAQSVLRNYSSQNLDYNMCTTHQPDVLAMFPGENGEKTVVRWTAPQSGQYSITGRFQNIDKATSDGSIVLNGNTAQPIFGPVLIDTPNSCHQTTVTRSFSLTVTVNAGDTIDFRVGRGSNNNYSFDGTGLAATVTSVPEGSCIQQPTGAVAWYRAEGNANDIQGSNNGTLQGNTTFTTGVVGQAFSFDGDGDAVESPATGLMNSPPLTIDAWVKPELRNDDTDFPTNAVSSDAPTQYGHGFGLNVFPGGSQLKVEYNDGFRVVPGTFIADQWYHITVVFTPGNVKTYVNGALADDFNFTQGANNGDTPLRIGKHNDDSSLGTRRFFKGQIDEVDVFNRALSASEIQAIYNAGSAGKCAPQCVQNPSGAVAWYTGEGNANDSQGANNGTLQNGATFAAGKVGQAFQFDGVDDFVQVADSPSLNSTSAVALEAWVYVTGGQGQDRDIIGTGGEASERQYLLSAASTNKYRAHIGVAGGFISFDGTTPVQLNTWTHITMTYDGTTLKLYVNGELDGAQAVTGAIITTTQPLRIGGGAPAGQPQNYFPGKVDETGIFNRALSQSEIQAIYNAGSAGKCAASPTPTPTPTPTPVSVASPVADYRFQDTYSSSVGTPPALTEIWHNGAHGTNSFTTDTVDGTSRRVLAFPLYNGVQIQPTTNVIQSNVYSIVMLFEFDDVSGDRRILDFKNGSSFVGLFSDSGNLQFSTYPGAPINGSGSPIAANTYIQVVLTRAANGTVTGYVNGTHQFSFVDTNSLAVIDASNAL
ncbi:MAG TPA: LamG domain-containing protein, partial [Pyrinomonadaceae bacterium]